MTAGNVEFFCGDKDTLVLKKHFSYIDFKVLDIRVLHSKCDHFTAKRGLKQSLL